MSPFALTNLGIYHWMPNSISLHSVEIQMNIRNLIIILALVSIAVYFFESVDVERQALPTIEVVVAPSSYSVGRERSRDLVALVTKIKQQRGENVDVILLVEDGVGFERLTKSMTVLKDNGFETVDLVNRN